MSRGLAFCAPTPRKNIRSHGLSQLELHAALPQNVDSPLDHGFLQLEGRDAVEQQPTRLGLGFEYGHRITHFCEFICAGESARSRADHRDAQTVGRPAGDRIGPVGKGVFVEELFNGSNTNGFGVADENA
jgi:hypothetical protein